jgi:hypothetical protein
MERELYIEQSTERMQKARTPDAMSVKKRLLAQTRISAVMGLLCLLPCHVAKAAEEGARPGMLSLTQALKLAEERNRTLENSALDVAIARDQVTAATFVTLLLVPVLYSICVRDLKIIDWETKKIPAAGDGKAGH